ncbi:MULTISPECIES: glutamine-hydrolyzing carbamoyl-phosphate synthase small subunit [Pseudomonas syringae group]|uniref:glutamine-hydrolyzing carbamoyl-phosphate synthase small subunit n=1 Tax=Pseudomonas syringae group TaxID=136849 RepID=UPI000BB638D0|nr:MULTISPECIES: glutamine-hydrolyzing carbamoyl-phosphate synthase small subunit [Pseudomonas syringae group]MCK9719205.1 glutamine-hydrolyzing carbamoyl-phosphate synthase small subunit [Pseudomonas syringae pv. syringae]MCK9764490.1 glutamine-hydrolyzing carbamoyl-phosphate synthase small subunit [Pseudomonas syringae pv. syringae]MCZ0946980.1 glutamine-hydrolyzing carbamoyl-phosphate synthase small subunit [Pseudomonas syringae pv. tomato]MDU8573632.1 glutamine-hydrolyzing carbamoyl-phospha
MTKPAILALADGSIFRGEAIGADGQTVGEVVFNTAMTGYQEILTDPSYAQQIVTLTYPHIGNTGTTPEDAESDRVWSAGLVIRDLPLVASNWRNKLSLGDYLKANNVVAIAGIDTRRLTRILREKGAQNGCILAGDNITEEAAIAAARSFPGLKGMDLAKEVCTKDTYEWRSSVWDLKTDSHPEIAASELPYHVVAYDYGVKVNILRMLVERGCRVTVVPAQMPASEVLAYQPDGVFLSNGPGDPEPCDYAIKAIREVLETDIPVFGICLGHQLLALAAGAKTVKMGHGHHGANHPVQDLDTGVVMITSQNHGFAVDEATLPSNVRAIHKSLFDGTLQGIELTDKSAFSFQGHPEASPGPNDVAPLFDRFIEAMAKRR